MNPKGDTCFAVVDHILFKLEQDKKVCEQKLALEKTRETDAWDQAHGFICGELNAIEKIIEYVKSLDTLLVSVVEEWRNP